jgi:hypothetical protein
MTNKMFLLVFYFPGRGFFLIDANVFLSVVAFSRNESSKARAQQRILQSAFRFATKSFGVIENEALDFHNMGKQTTISGEPAS